MDEIIRRAGRDSGYAAVDSAGSLVPWYPAGMLPLWVK